MQLHRRAILDRDSTSFKDGTVVCTDDRNDKPKRDKIMQLMSQVLIDYRTMKNANSKTMLFSG